MCLGAGRPQDNVEDAAVLAWGHVSLEEYCRSNAAKLVTCTSKSTSASECDADSKSESSTDSRKVCEALFSTPGGLVVPERDVDSKSEISTDSGKASDAPARTTNTGRLAGSRNTPQVHKLVSMYNELSQAREKQKQCISLLQNAASMREHQPGEQPQALSRQLGTVAQSVASLQDEPKEQPRALSRQASSGEFVPRLKSVECNAAGGRRAALSEVQARHALCIELARDRKKPAFAVQGTAQDLPGGQDVAREEPGHKDLLPVLSAQIAVNHVTELAELRKIKEAQEKLQFQHEALLVESSSLRLRNEALMEELRSQAQRDVEQPGSDSSKLSVAQFGTAAAVAVVTGAILAVARGRS